MEVAVAPFAIAAGWGQTRAEAIVAAAQPATASTVPATATAVLGTAAKVISLPDVLAGDGSVGGHALIAVLAGITRTSNAHAVIDRDVGAIAVDARGRSAACRVEPAATSLIGAAAVITGGRDEIAGERSISASARGAVTTALSRPSKILDKAAEPIDTGGVAAASLVGATTTPHVGAAVERAVEREPIVSTDERGIGGQAVAAIEAWIARTESGVMGRDAATGRSRQGHESGSGAGKDADALPPRETGSQHPGQAIEPFIIHATPPLPLFVSADELPPRLLARDSR